MKKSEIIKNILYPLLGAIIFVIIWQIAAAIMGVELILPSPISTFESLSELLCSVKFWSASLSTVLRSIYSFLIALVTAGILATLSFKFPVFAKIISPIIVILNAVPTMSIIMLTLIWMSASSSPVLVGFLIVFPIFYNTIYTALKGVDKRLVQMSKFYKVSNFDMATKLYLPNILPALLSQASNAISLSIKVIISGEVIAMTAGSMGTGMQTAKIFLNTAELLAWTLMAVVFSYILSLAITGLGKLIMRWNNET